MASKTHTPQRVVIVGGGVAGLSIAVRLAQSGLPVTLLEASKLGFASTTRNQGWLHSGAWFAPCHSELARLCYRSLEQTLQFCPGCLEPQTKPLAFVVSRPDTNVATWTRSWRETGIPFSELEVEPFLSELPGFERLAVQHAFELPDRAIRWHVLLEHLAAAATNAGAEVRTETPVVDLLDHDGCIHGVVTGEGEEIGARLVVLAGNAAGASLWPGSGEARVGEQAQFTNVVLKAHLLALQPEVSRRPYCVVDAEGFNHIPHLQTSVFGLADWRVVPHAADANPEPERIAAIWDHVTRFYPELQRNEYEVTEWAGLTVQSMHPDQVEPGVAPLPTVIDYGSESPCTGNLLSVFTGRATLWACLAEQARKLILEKLGGDFPETARPPWECPG